MLEVVLKDKSGMFVAEVESVIADESIDNLLFVLYEVLRKLVDEEGLEESYKSEIIMCKDDSKYGFKLVEKESFDSDQ